MPLEMEKALLCLPGLSIDPRGFSIDPRSGAGLDSLSLAAAEVLPLCGLLKPPNAFLREDILTAMRPGCKSCERGESSVQRAVAVRVVGLRNKLEQAPRQGRLRDAAAGEAGSGQEASTSALRRSLTKISHTPDSHRGAAEWRAALGCVRGQRFLRECWPDITARQGTRGG